MLYLIRPGQTFYLFDFLPMIPLGYHGKKGGQVFWKNETPTILAFTFFEMPALPKGKRFWGCNVPFNIRKSCPGLYQSCWAITQFGHFEPLVTFWMNENRNWVWFLGTGTKPRPSCGTGTRNFFNIYIFGGNTSLELRVNHKLITDFRPGYLELGLIPKTQTET